MLMKRADALHRLRRVTAWRSWILRSPALAVLWSLSLWLAVRAVWMVMAIIARRARFPYDLEWMEGGMVTHSLRILQGLPIYVEPSFEFTPFIYNPLFHVLGAGAIAVLGPGPLALRVVAVLFTGVLCVSLFELVRRETRNPAVSFLSVAVYLSFFLLNSIQIFFCSCGTT